MKKNNKVYAVIFTKGNSSIVEIVDVYNRKSKAIKRIYEERNKIMTCYEELDKLCINNGYKDNIYKQLKKNLSNKDYTKWNNYPHDNLYIRELTIK